MKLLILLNFCFGMFSAVWAANGSGGVKKIVFAEERIEGKIRRPQLVLIQAEQRPEFSPMVMQSLSGNTNIVEFVSESVVEDGAYSGAFGFKGTSISSYIP